MSHAEIWGENNLDSGNSKYLCLELGTCLVCSMNRELTTVAKAEQVRERVVRDELGEATGP